MKHKTLTACISAVVSVSLCTGVSADTMDISKIQNREMIMSETAYLRDFLSVHSAIPWDPFINTDLNNDGTLDARDLTLIKRRIMHEHTQRDLPEAPIKALGASLPSTGHPRIPVFAVSFPDCAFETAEIKEQLEKRCFGLQDPFDFIAHPMESIYAYFDRSSYGGLQIEGDVFTYTAKDPAADYSDNNGRKLVEEVLGAYEEQLDYSRYDADSDQVIDAVIITVPEAAKSVDADGDRKPDWWPFSISDNCTKTFDGLSVGTYCAGIWAENENEQPEFCNKMAHELCHAMGLPDYYKYTDDVSTFSNEGMEGKAGFELMDEGYGDLSAFSKLMLGWFAEDEIFIYTGGEQTFTLTSMQQKPACVIIPRDPDAGFLSEFFLIEYLTGEENNTTYFSNGRANKLIDGISGARFLHCQAEVTEGTFGPEFKYGNNSPYYDDSNHGIRVLRMLNSYDLINSMNSLQKIFDGDTPDFHWYNDSGETVIETGLWLRITGPNPGPDFPYDTSPTAAFIPYWEPSFINGSTITVEIKPYEPVPDIPDDPEDITAIESAESAQA